MTNILTRRHGKKDFIVMANKSVRDIVAQVTSMLSLLLAAIAGISLFVGGIGIMNIMLVSVTCTVTFTSISPFKRDRFSVGVSVVLV